MTESVNELLNRIRNNDSVAFDELSSEYAGLIHNAVYGFIKSGMTKEDAEDMEQEARVCLLKAARTFDFASGLTFGLYAQICIRNGLISLERKRKSEPHVADIGLDDLKISVPDTTIEIDENESAAILLDKIHKLLSNSEIDVLNLRLKNLNRAEIAEDLGISVKSVDNAVSRIKRKLRILLS